MMKRVLRIAFEDAEDGQGPIAIVDAEGLTDEEAVEKAKAALQDEWNWSDADVAELPKPSIVDVSGRVVLYIYESESL